VLSPENKHYQHLYKYLSFQWMEVGVDGVSGHRAQKLVEMEPKLEPGFAATLHRTMVDWSALETHLM
jgi:hypothetical protein